MACQHRWVVEPPWEARARWDRDNATHVMIGKCKLCGATREYRVDDEEDDEE